MVGRDRAARHSRVGPLAADAARMVRPTKARRSTSASGIVLAGGRSRRFGTNKLAVQLDGRPLLEHAVAAVASVCDEVIVVVPPHSEAPAGPPTNGGGGGVPRRVVRDDEPFGGPLLGLVAGLRAARRPLALVVGGDMPGLPPGLLGAMLAAAGPDEHRPTTAVALRTGNGIQALPFVLPSVALATVESLVASGRRALRDVFEALPVRVLEPDEWRAYDPTGTALADVDRVTDLGPFGAPDGGSRPGRR